MAAFHSGSRAIGGTFLPLYVRGKATAAGRPEQLPHGPLAPTCLDHHLHLRNRLHRFPSTLLADLRLGSRMDLLMPAPTDKSHLESLLAAHGHQHLLTFWDELNETGRFKLASQIEAIDFDLIAALKGHRS